MADPGQQARVRNDDLAVIATPNEAEVLAWTTGYFNFMEADIKTIMRQVESWYDVDVRYAKTPA
ncbi:FecR domain-containing protein [Terrimonas ferruginea]|uniref:FecR domain-containing protein n=1 Tax=Terrimonas ferruginea TaxID=249 RepID=UPI00041839F3|nr:DUF4974 domain-containing protein [Terrimonas ferruginea]